jgi:glutaredoxin
VTLITLFGKPDCPLCDEARAVLERVRADHPFELAERDIADDDELHRAYFERIPVIALDGEELFDYHVDEPALRARLRGRDPGPPLH